MRCLVPQEEQAKLGVQFLLRTTGDTLEILQEANAASTKTEQKMILKKYSLRPVAVSYTPYSIYSILTNIHHLECPVYDHEFRPVLRTFL